MTDAQAWTVALWLSAGLASVFFSAIYSGAETGTYCLNRIRLHLRTARGERAAARLQHFLGNPTRLIVAVLIGNNVVNYVSTASATVLLVIAGLSKHQAEATTILLVTPILFVLGEIVPKTLFRKHADTLTYRWSLLLTLTERFFTWIGLVGLVYTFARVARRLVRAPEGAEALPGNTPRIRELLVETAHTGTLTGQQSMIAQNVFELTQMRVKDVMVPFARVVRVRADISHGEFVEVAGRAGNSRVPVVSPTSERRILGVVTVREALLLPAEGFDVQRVMREPIELRATTNVQTALTALQRTHHKMGIVVDPQRRCVGIVTIKDLVEEIVGELHAW